jgi:hypothetical protein
MCRVCSVTDGSKTRDIVRRSPRFLTRAADFGRRGFSRARPRALDPLILRRGGDASRRRRERRRPRRATRRSGGERGRRRRARGRRRTAGQTTPALLEHADTVAKARLHHPTGIDTSIVPADGTGKAVERIRSER